MRWMYLLRVRLSCIPYFICFRSLQTFNGNVDRNSVRVNWFPIPVVARYIRVVAQSWTSPSAPCFRIDLYGCKNCKSVLLYWHFGKSSQLCSGKNFGGKNWRDLLKSNHHSKAPLVSCSGNDLFINKANKKKEREKERKEEKESKEVRKKKLKRKEKKRKRNRRKKGI